MKVALLLSLAAGLAAQTPVLGAETAVGVHLVDASGVHHQAVPAMTVVAMDAVVSVAGAPGWPSTAAATARAHGARALFLEHGYGYSRFVTPVQLGTAQAAAQPASHAWRWQLSGPRNGELVATWSAARQGSSPVFRCEIDVDADGSVEFTFPAPSSGTIRFPLSRPAGFVVRVQFEGSVTRATPNLEGYTSTLDLAWVETHGVPPVSILPNDPLRPPCGARLWITDVPAGREHVLGHEVSGAFAGGPVVLVFGVEPALIPIPNSPCHLGLVPRIALPAIADARCAARWSLRVPGPIAAAVGFAQAVATDAGFTTWVASDTFRIGFAD